MKYKLYIHGFLWYVDNQKKTISETPDFKDEHRIRDICTKQEREQIADKIRFNEAIPV